MDELYIYIYIHMYCAYLYPETFWKHYFGMKSRISRVQVGALTGQLQTFRILFFRHCRCRLGQDVPCSAAYYFGY